MGFAAIEFGLTPTNERPIDKPPTHKRQTDKGRNHATKAKRIHQSTHATQEKRNHQLIETTQKSSHKYLAYHSRWKNHRKITQLTNASRCYHGIARPLSNFYPTCSAEKR
jgi:hypothetical protein